MSMVRREEDLKERIGYAFRNSGLLREALTHSSFANESPDSGVRDNERLEFLGDAVLGLAAACFLGSAFPHAREGELSRLRAALVGQKSLAAVARDLDLGSFLHLGRGEDLTGGREKESILAGALEALVGAVFRDGGWVPAYGLAQRLFGRSTASGTVLHRAADAKTGLQELCQQRSRTTPTYRLVDQSGPAHSPRFTVAVLLEGGEVARGQGSSKKDAEQAAAAAAMKRLMSPEEHP